MLARKKILTVDDDALNRDILNEYLSEGGYEVVEADDGDTALQILAETRAIDAIVLDRMMPRLNGMEVLKAVKEDSRLRDIPVICSRRQLRGNKFSRVSGPVYITI